MLTRSKSILIDFHKKTLLNNNFRYNYKLLREYTWSVKKNTDLEENCNFIFKDDGVYYNPLATRVRLNKRRAKGGKISNIRLAVKYRNYTRDELKQQVNFFID